MYYLRIFYFQPKDFIWIYLILQEKNSQRIISIENNYFALRKTIKQIQEKNHIARNPEEHMILSF